MTIVDTGCHRPDRDRLIAVRRDPAAAWRSEPLDRKIQYARRHGAELPSAASETTGRPRPRTHLQGAGLPAQPLADRRRQAVRRRRPARHPGRAGHRLPGVAVAARDQQPRADRPRHGRRHGGHLPLRGGRPRPDDPRRQGPPRARPLLPHQPRRRAGLHGRRGGRGQGQGAGQDLRLDPHGRRHRQDPQRAPGEHRPARRRPVPGDRGPQQPPRRRGRRPLPDVPDRHRARLVRITGAQRRVGARGAAQPRRAGAGRAGPARSTSTAGRPPTTRPSRDGCGWRTRASAPRRSSPT